MNNSADVRIDKYDETIEVNNGTDVHIDKYSDNAQRSSACKIRFEGGSLRER